MSEQKIKMKINRYEKHIGKDDLILDNGSCVQVVTQRGAFAGWRHADLIMSKKMFNELKRFGFLYLDEVKTEQANKRYRKQILHYYRFDIDKMIASGGYEVVQE